MIEWLESYSVGIKVLDQQHKELFSYCNDLENILRDGDVPKDLLEQGLAYLERYAANHFLLEEGCMHQYACPAAKSNKAAHQKFIQSYKLFEKEINRDTNLYRALRGLHTFLESWLIEHICNIDTRLKPCVRE